MKHGSFYSWSKRSALGLLLLFQTAPSMAFGGLLVEKSGKNTSWDGVPVFIGFLTLEILKEPHNTTHRINVCYIYLNLVSSYDEYRIVVLYMNGGSEESTCTQYMLLKYIILYIHHEMTYLIYDVNICIWVFPKIGEPQNGWVFSGKPY